MTTTSYERPPEETKRLAHWAGAAYLALGVAAFLGFFHAPLVRDDINALARTITASDFRFRVGVVADVLTAVLLGSVGLLFFQLLEVVHKGQGTLMGLLLLLATSVVFVVGVDLVAGR